MSSDTVTSDKTGTTTKNGSKLLLHSFAAILIGVGIVAVFATGLAVFNNNTAEKEAPETAYLIRFPENEDMLSRLPREIIEGTAFENITPAAGENSPASAE